MTPLQIEMLLHYHCRGIDFRDGDFSAPAVGEAIGMFIDTKMLTKNDGADVGAPDLKISDRGRAFIDYICSLPLPVQKWEMPS